MKLLFVLLLAFPVQLPAQVSGDTLYLKDLVLEAMRNHPEMKAAEYNRDMMDARTEGVGLLMNPELTYMREEMPGFRWNEAMMQKFELMQMVPFPGKLSTESEIAEIQAEHAHHEHMEIVNDLLAKLRSAYYELWFVQQSIALNRENAMLLQQFTKTAQTRFGVGSSSQAEVLKSFVEIAKLDNQLIVLRQQELSAKAMLVALLNRSPEDTLGIAVVPRNVMLKPSVDTLQYLAFRFRGMLLHDSLSVEESHKMLSLAKKEYLPDFKFGMEYKTNPSGDFKGWGVSAGITLPFAPWTIGRANAKVEEASIGLEKSRQTLQNTRNMIRSNITDLYVRAQSYQKQLENYSTVIVPQSEQALRAGLIAYQTGKTDYLMLIDSYRMLVDLSMEKLMLRMQFEQTVAHLKREVGYAGIFEIREERN